MEPKLTATADMVRQFHDLFVNRRAYTVQSMRPHPESGRHYYFRPVDRTAGRPLGLIAAMDRQPMRDAALAEAMLKIFSVRVVAEIDRASSEETLRVREQQYRAIFNASADALVLRDADFRIVDVNATYEAMSGYTRDTVVGNDRVFANPPAAAGRSDASAM